MTHVITDACVDEKDASCMEECPVDCIYEGGSRMYIHPGECIDCGLCAEVCPNGAAVALRLLDPAAAAVHGPANDAFFTQVLPGRQAPLGSPGGASRLGPLDADPS
ncbi:ferredoxin family protein [Streptomyces tirandamycinicus]|uniref:indolepyruvate ferredoxin oxidoreductase subunit alpha n=1 Tax=Streptomyces tirandamycinicus TaxID=2174846 RepID=UPI00037D2CE0